MLHPRGRQAMLRHSQWWTMVCVCDVVGVAGLCHLIIIMSRILSFSACLHMFVLLSVCPISPFTFSPLAVFCNLLPDSEDFHTSEGFLAIFFLFITFITCPIKHTP